MPLLDPYELISDLTSALERERLDHAKVESMFEELVHRYSTLLTYVRTLPPSGIPERPYHPPGKIDYIARRRELGGTTPERERQIMEEIQAQTESRARHTISNGEAKAGSSVLTTSSNSKAADTDLT